MSKPPRDALKRRGAEPPNLLWLGVSLFVHAAMLLGFVLAGGGWRARAGENGHGGANDVIDAVEVTFLAPHTETPSVEVAPENYAPEASTEPTSEQPENTTVRSASRALTAPSASVAVSTSESATAATETGRSEVAVSNGAPTSGTPSEVAEVGEVTSEDALAQARRTILGASGRLEGSAVQTAQLLGQRIACTDPVEGTWVAYRYSPEYRDWARFTLHIDREDARLRGTIVARMWRGMASDRNPPPCGPDGWDYTVTMEATGNLIGDQLAFGANTHRVSTVACPSSFFSYNPDHFTGRVDGLSDRMHTLNNDGGRDINAVYEFRRLRCD